MARFRKSQRLLTSREFDKVLNGPHTKIVCTDFVLVASSGNPEQPLRLGLIVSGKVGNAVVRNRIKRCVRSVFQSDLAVSPRLIGRDLVVIARPTLVDKSGYVKTNLQEKLRQCADRLVARLN